MATTHTFAILEVSKATFDEIAEKFKNADYGHAFMDIDEGLVIDMNGVALKQEGGDPVPVNDVVRKYGVPYERITPALAEAAPDLLLACQKFVKKVEEGKAKSTETYNEMKAAIAKALPKRTSLEEEAVKFADRNYQRLHRNSWDCLYEAYVAGAASTEEKSLKIKT